MTTAKPAMTDVANNLLVWKFKDNTLKPVTELSAQELYDIYAKTRGTPEARHSQGQPAIINREYVAATLAAIEYLFHEASLNGKITAAMREAHMREVAAMLPHGSEL